MIPVAMELSGGDKHATHLMNAFQNDYVELASIRGAVADDLHGAFAEWELQAHALTKCKNYLYALAISPDESQGRLTRAQYDDYITRAEEKLGLTSQPRAVVFHIKDGREHCHVVWSKVDVENEKAVHLAFDHDKLMTVSRQFARDHDLSLPEGYHKKNGSDRQPPTQFERQQERATGITKEDRMEQVTEAWRASDSAKAFVKSLEEKGYLLATGKRPYVLVDFYGGMASLPKMIDDKSVRAKDVAALLADEYPPESLPSVDEAKKIIADYRKIMEGYLKEEQRGAQLSMLKKKQEHRRKDLLSDQKAIKIRQDKERLFLQNEQKREREELRNQHLSVLKELRDRRYKPTGLAAFLGKVSGVNLIREKLHKRQDRKAIDAYLEERSDLKARQEAAKTEQQRRHEFENLESGRKLRSLEKVEQRELATLNESIKREARIHMRGGKAQMPSLNLDLSPPGRRAVPHKAKNRYKNRGLEDQFKKARDSEKAEIDLTETFAGAAGEGDGAASGEQAGGTGPRVGPAVQRYGRKRSSGKAPGEPRGPEEDRDL
ncbi:MAG: relaxase [Halioglobus sp.]|nr:relaxase [Halioglobus sp.]